MPGIATPLTGAKLRTAAPGRYHDGDDFCLLVRKGNSGPNGRPAPERAFWLLRYSIGGRVRESGLGRARGHNPVTLEPGDAGRGARRCAANAGQGQDARAEARHKYQTECERS